MDKIVTRYKQFLKRSGEYFAEALKKHHVKCKHGCHECCSAGFFDVTLLDWMYLKRALARLPAGVRGPILLKAHEQLDILEKKKAFYRNKPLLKSEAEIKALSRRSSGMSCPALDPNGSCLIYNDRPHICRIFGPTIRGRRRRVWLRGCGFYEKDIPVEDSGILEQHLEETILMNALSEKSERKQVRNVDTIIPAALVLDPGKWLQSKNRTQKRRMRRS